MYIELRGQAREVPRSEDRNSTKGKVMFKKLVRWWRSFILGYMDCPKCNKQTLTCEKVPIFHPEEPPCFVIFECSNPDCQFKSGIVATQLMDKAARKHGYKDFDDYLEKKVK